MSKYGTLRRNVTDKCDRLDCNGGGGGVMNEYVLEHLFPG